MFPRLQAINWGFPFQKYARFCSQFALETIICLLTTTVAGVTLNMKSPDLKCCMTSSTQENLTNDVMLLLIIRCGSIINTFMQIKQVVYERSLSVLLLVSLNLIFASVIFYVISFHFLHEHMTGDVITVALPVFLLFVDFSRITTVTKHVISSNSYDRLHDNIAVAMGAMMPGMTLDTVFKMSLVHCITARLPVHQIQTLGCSAVVAIAINYVIFLTFVPVCLSLALSTAPQTTKQPGWRDNRFATALRHHDNVINRRFNLILCAIHSFKLIACHYVINDAITIQERFDSLMTLPPDDVIFDIVLITVVIFEYFFNVNDDDVTTPVTSPTLISPPRDVIESSRDQQPRSMKKCFELLDIGADLLSDQEIIAMVTSKKLPAHSLEKRLQDANRAICIRRAILQKATSFQNWKSIPHKGYDFTIATKSCCENVIGYTPVPLGLVGPLLLDGKRVHVPMATTEGTLLASTNRGMKALLLSGGVTSCIYDDGMTRSPVVEFTSVVEAVTMTSWLKSKSNFEIVKSRFDETSNFAQLKKIQTSISGRLVFIRFKATTGDAMGMNMVSKATENVLRFLQGEFPSMKVISLSGNFCTDKKPAAINWIEGRGKSVVCEAVLPSNVVQNILKTDIKSLVHLNKSKNLIGSAMAGSIGGFNAHAANIVTAIYIATGQDPAQVVVSSNCMTSLEEIDSSLVMTCTMPSVEVATVGGGTVLESQRACLGILGVSGACKSDVAGSNASKLARIVCGSVLAGELSLLSALSTGDLVKSHMAHNRLSQPITNPQLNHSIL